jgi:hypothetical protein
MNVVLENLQNIQNWLSDPQRIIDAQNMGQALWNGSLIVLEGLAAALMLVPEKAVEALLQRS